MHKQWAEWPEWMAAMAAKGRGQGDPAERKCALGSRAPAYGSARCVARWLAWRAAVRTAAVGGVLRWNIGQELGIRVPAVRPMGQADQGAAW
jgi:hypothetical protein